tara:strand:- start:2242 stop:2514 length:273 start_codon:yes stop_codon:yes gene_type:complete
MIKKITNILVLIFFFIFLFLISNHYFSEKNIILTSKSRSSYAININKHNKNLPVLKNDTNNIITYQNGIEEFKKKRKKRFWEKLISSKNE